MSQLPQCFRNMDKRKQTKYGELIHLMECSVELIIFNLGIIFKMSGFTNITKTIRSGYFANHHIMASALKKLEPI